MEWITEHLGHTLDVHKLHYRLTSDVIKRMQVAKLLLIQDFVVVKQFVDKSLEDIQIEGTTLIKSPPSGM